MQDENSFALTRRSVLVSGSTLVATAGMSGCAADALAPADAADGPEAPSSQVRLRINGRDVRLQVDNRTSLLDVLREHLSLTGTKKGCDHGQCGACTVSLNGRRINSCLTLAVMEDGSEITTIEGLGAAASLHPMQRAFVQHDGYQCGYCTPGQICSAVAVLDEIGAGIPSHVTANLTARPPLSAEEIRERMSGNICRCGAYSNIVDAVLDVARKRA